MVLSSEYERYHSLLEVAPGASEEELKISFRRLALRYHPDKCPDPSQTEAYTAKFQEISHAYKKLTSDEDVIENENDFSWFNPGEIITELFGRFFSCRSKFFAFRNRRSYFTPFDRRTAEETYRERSNRSHEPAAKPKFDSPLPGQPTLAMSSATSNSIFLIWDIPESCFPIKRYVLEMDRIPGEVPSVDYEEIYVGPANEFEVKNLMPSSTYHFLVQAESSAGHGQYSRCGSFQTLAADDEEEILPRKSKKKQLFDENEQDEAEGEQVNYNKGRKRADAQPTRKQRTQQKQKEEQERQQESRRQRIEKEEFKEFVRFMHTMSENKNIRPKKEMPAGKAKPSSDPAPSPPTQKPSASTHSEERPHTQTSPQTSPQTQPKENSAQRRQRQRAETQVQESIDTILNMGFTLEQALNALERTRDVNSAIEYIFKSIREKEDEAVAMEVAKEEVPITAGFVPTQDYEWVSLQEPEPRQKRSKKKVIHEPVLLDDLIPPPKAAWGRDIENPESSFWVNNLPDGLTYDDVIELFSPFGEITEVQMNPAFHRVIISFTYREDALEAMKKMELFKRFTTTKSSDTLPMHARAPPARRSTSHATPPTATPSRHINPKTATANPSVSIPGAAKCESDEEWCQAKIRPKPKPKPTPKPEPVPAAKTSPPIQRKPAPSYLPKEKPKEEGFTIITPQDRIKPVINRRTKLIRNRKKH